MSLFQHSVLNKYLQAIDEGKVNEAWEKFTTYFHDPERQENIRNIKEEEYGIDFLIKFFVNILGYTKNPDPNFNLKAEQKNLTDPKKADGAILQNEKVIGVIELKGMDTTDLGGKVEVQAFGYKNHQPEAVYVITSNFEKLRFYIDNAVDFEEFNLFQLTQERFKILWLCLAKENVFKGIPKKIKDESLEEEELITKKLYSDYSTFKHEIFNSIVELNPQYDKLILFKKTQKLLDRFLFIFFAEDRLLLPPNSISEIIKQWTELKDKYDEYRPLYDRFKKYFEYMNTGFKGKEHSIFAYNGGLFKSDNVLDQIKINDEVLYQHSLQLSHYDFESEVSVNILGHIFEHSLNEIEEMTAELEGKEVDKSKTKRKKDGVYYTPKYITKYIVENTVGKLCEEKKVELKIIEEEFEKERKGRRKTTLKTLQNKLEKYRQWLLELTICDPACGSGAFLIQALDFLINEHRYIDELNRKLLGHSIEFPNVEKSILENNLYGVDINDEAVEIAKLSLWLRTAQKGRKLTTLSNNIKCGNSLIDDIEIAGEKAFKWETEFEGIFKNGGFDVVIGNPPYTYRNAIKDIEKKYFKFKYKATEGNFDLYKFFMELIQNITKEKGLSSLIVPNTFLTANTYKKLRNGIIESFEVLEFFDLGLDIFEGVVVENVIFLFRKSLVTVQKTQIKIQRDRHRDFYNLQKSYVIDISEYGGSDATFNIYISKNAKTIIDLMWSNAIPLKEICYCTVGINTGYIKNELTSTNKVDERYNKMLNGKNIGRNTVSWQGDWIMYDSEYVISRGDKGRTLPPKYIFDDDKILIQRTRRGMKRKLVCYYDSERYYNLNRLSNVVLTDKEFDLKYIYLLLNSKLMDYYFNIYYNEYEIKPLHISKLPIFQVDKKIQFNFSNKADKILELNRQLQDNKNKFISRLKDNFSIEKISRKLDAFYLYDFSSVINELKKQKISFKLREQDEWSGYFEEYKDKINQLQAEIDKTDRGIDLMVYKLYGLTEREIMIVEGRE